MMLLSFNVCIERQQQGTKCTRLTLVFGDHERKDNEQPCHVAHVSLSGISVTNVLRAFAFCFISGGCVSSIPVRCQKGQGCVQVAGALDAVCTAAQTVLFRSGVRPHVGRRTNLDGDGGCHTSSVAHSVPLVVVRSLSLFVHKARHLFAGDMFEIRTWRQTVHSRKAKRPPTRMVLLLTTFVSSLQCCCCCCWRLQWHDG